MYSLSKGGRRAAGGPSLEHPVGLADGPGRGGRGTVSIGSLLDRFTEDSSLRRRLARTEQREQIEAILARAGAEIERTLQEGEDDG
jgi:hypothetical protein